MITFFYQEITPTWNIWVCLTSSTLSDETFNIKYQFHWILVFFVIVWHIINIQDLALKLWVPGRCRDVWGVLTISTEHNTSTSQELIEVWMMKNTNGCLQPLRTTVSWWSPDTQRERERDDWCLPDTNPLNNSIMEVIKMTTDPIFQRQKKDVKMTSCSRFFLEVNAHGIWGVSPE